MNKRIYSRISFLERAEELIGQAYANNQKAVDFVLLFEVAEEEKEWYIEQLLSLPLVVSARWRFTTVMITAYIRS